MKMRRGSGPFTGAPSTSTSPEVAGRNPPTTFRSVDFPQPLGPTMQTNSPGATMALMSCKTSMRQPFLLPGNETKRPRIQTAGGCSVMSLKQTSNIQHRTLNIEWSRSASLRLSTFMRRADARDKDANQFLRLGENRIEQFCAIEQWNASD